MLPPNIRQWLNNRGLPDTVIDANGLDWNGTHIVIPIYDSNGKYLFNKYRRNPFTNGAGPKYKYDNGTKTQLYNVQKIKDGVPIIIVEGEFDALILEAHDYCAISSTGGAGTFLTEWIPMLENRKLYVCFDNDQAGYEGAIKILTKLPARLVTLPPQVGEHGDVTDFFVKLRGDFDQLLFQATEYPFLYDPPAELKTIQAIRLQIKQYNKILDELLAAEKQLQKQGRQNRHIYYIKKLLWNANDNLKREIKRRQYLKQPAVQGDGLLTNIDVIKAKQVPIETFYEGKLIRQYNRAIGLCPFHLEKTPSFTIYVDQNRWHCYGCSTDGDVIDFLMKRDGCTFPAAVKTLLNK